MPRVQTSIVVPGRIDEAEALYYDVSRRPTWVDGFAHVVRVDDGWPADGELSWNSRPGGRGRVVERVGEHVAGGRQSVRVEDESLTGTQTVHFSPEGDDDTRVTVELEFELKDRSPLGPLRGFFVRRAMADSLRRTLWRFAVEREGDLRPP